MFARIANILGWAGVALVLAGFALWLLRPQMLEVRQWLGFAGLGCILVYVLSQWREMVDSFRGRQARYGSLSAISLVVVLAILVGINYIATRQNKRWDLTASQEYTLSDQTRRMVQSLKQPLKLLVFEREERMQPFRDRLSEYQYLSKLVQVDYIDVDKQPALARQYQIQAFGTIAVDYQGRTERATGTAEQDITNAIVKAVQGQQKKVYFVTGHGEHDPASADERTGYNGAKQALERDNFTVDTLALVQVPEVPADASVVVVAGPTTDYLAPEIESLKRYLAKGGKALFMIDPPDRTDAAPLPNLIALVREWGMEVGENVIVDRSGIGQLLGRGPGMPVATNYPSHPITERFNVVSAFPLARSVSPAVGATRVAQTIVETSPQSWAESDVKALAEQRAVTFDENTTDRQGPVSIAAAVTAPASDVPAPPATPPGQPAPADEPPKPETRVVAFGDSDFVSNDGLGIPGNADLFLNTVNWLAQQENLIAIRPKQPDDRRVTLTADQQTWVAWFSILLLPGAVLATGVYSWWRRRG